ncbi:hypothetical protein M3Y98_00824700 [Aphelenchoides besseyi]|nr:hypothetical protein M3Y98_00824700 [Aphelenchoides besseyi]KAI6195358.1 hypothetical protein M3Y96_01222800 [Aphelenchoides besseyi]
MAEDVKMNEEIADSQGEPMDTSDRSGEMNEKATGDEITLPSTDVAVSLARLLERLNATKLPNISDPNALFRFLGAEIKKSFNGLNRRPRSITTSIRLKNVDWQKADKYAEFLTADFSRRAALLVQRLDVTVDSFFWSDRVREQESAIKDIFLPERDKLDGWSPITVADVLGATEDILFLEKASSHRQQTRSSISSFTLPTAPQDRGGRTGEIIAPNRETFGQQRNQQYHRGRGRGHHGNRHHGGPNRFDHFNKQRDNRVENQVKREYADKPDHSHGKKQRGN